MNVPDYVSPIIGHRVWLWGASEPMSINGELWRPSKPLVAECKRGASHQPPHIDCSCGVYAAKTTEQLTAFGLRPYGICGEVYLWGTIVEHRFGWRAQFAYPKSFVLPPEVLLFGRFVHREIKTEEVKALLSPLTAYGADLSMGTEKENTRLWTRDSGYDAGAIECVSTSDTPLKVAVPIAVLMEGQSSRSLAQNGSTITQPDEIVFTVARFPLNSTDPIVCQIQNRRARVVVLDVNLQNLQGALLAVEIITRVASHLSVVVKGDLSSHLRFMLAALLGKDTYMYLGVDSGYDILADFVCLSEPRVMKPAPEREAPPTASVCAPVRKGPRPLRPRRAALPIPISV